MRPLSIAFAIVVGVLAGALLYRGLAPVNRSAPGFRLEAVPGITDPMRFAAMISVHAHAGYPDDNERPPVMPLRTAISVLVRDVEAATPSRRRRAAAALLSAGLRRTPSDLEVARFRGEVSALGVDPDFIEESPEWLAHVSFPIPESWILESIVADKLVYFTPTCPWMSSDSGDVREPPPMGWSYSAKIPRAVSDIARAFDPQKWDECSTLFTSTYLADVASSCCGSTSGDCSFPSDADRPAAATAIPAGKPYSKRAVFENYCGDKDGGCGSCREASCQVDFSTLLCTETQYDTDPGWHWLAACASRYSVDFTLGAWLRTEVEGSGYEFRDHSTSGYRIEVDQGRIEVQEIDSPLGFPWSYDWSRVEVDKEVHLKDPGYTKAAGILLKLFKKEIGQQIVEQACCDVPVEPWSPWTFW